MMNNSNNADFYSPSFLTMPPTEKKLETLDDLPADSPLRPPLLQYLNGQGLAKPQLTDLQKLVKLAQDVERTRVTCGTVLDTLRLCDGELARIAPAAPATLRWMLKNDLVTVATMEAATHEQPLHISSIEQLAEGRQNISKIVEMPQEDGILPKQDRAVGYMIFQLRTDSIGLLTLGIPEQQRRSGVVEHLLADLVRKIAGGSMRRMLTNDIVSMHTKEQQSPQELLFAEMVSGKVTAENLAAWKFRLIQVLQCYPQEQLPALLQKMASLAKDRLPEHVAE